MKKILTIGRKLLMVLFLMVLGTYMCYAEWAPAKTNRMVNDYAGLLSNSEQATLESRLEAFSDSTSNQIVLITTNTLDGDEIKAVGQRIGQSWGVGGSDYNNGVIILILCSETEGNEAAILTGYGLEGALPDLFCKRILDDRMIPHFMEDDYYGGIIEALEVIEPTVLGEYDYEKYQIRERREGVFSLLFTIIILVIIFYCLSRYSKNHPNGGNGNYSGGGTTFTNFGNSWGNFNGSSSGGGFGGFGGGSFGGGGASSRW